MCVLLIGISYTIGGEKGQMSCSHTYVILSTSKVDSLESVYFTNKNLGQKMPQETELVSHSDKETYHLPNPTAKVRLNRNSRCC
jgi:hypothetical protein